MTTKRAINNDRTSIAVSNRGGQMGVRKVEHPLTCDNPLPISARLWTEAARGFRTVEWESEPSEK